MKHSAFVVLTLTLVVAMVACGGGLAADTPEQGAKAFLQALADSDGLKLDDRTCSVQKDSLRQGTLIAAVLGAAVQAQIGQQTKIDVSEVKLSVINNTGNVANVQVAGRVRAAIGLAVQSQELNATWRMVLEGDKWKYCGEALIQSIGNNSTPTALAVNGTQMASDPLIDRMLQILIQPDEVPTSDLQLTNDTGAKSSKDIEQGATGEALNLIRQSGLITYATRAYSSPSYSTNCTGWCAIVVTVYLFKASDGAAQFFGYTSTAGRDALAQKPSTKFTIIPLTGLGDEAYGRKITDSGFEYPSYDWRTGRFMIDLQAVAKSGLISDADMRRLVYCSERIETKGPRK